MDFDFKDLLEDKVGLPKIDKLFLDYLKDRDKEMLNSILYLRQNKIPIEKSEEYQFMIFKLPVLIEEFLIQVFKIESKIKNFKKNLPNIDSIYKAKKLFVQRYVLQKYDSNSVSKVQFEIISQSLEKILGKFSELKFAELILLYMKDLKKYSKEIEIFAQYSAYQVFSNSSLLIFNVARKKNLNEPLIRKHKIGQYSKEVKFQFNYRDKGNKNFSGLLESKYCIYCHKRNKDTCSKGLEIIGDKYKDKAFDGCPLDQKISEMNLQVSLGNYIAALAIILLDNPLFVLTGKRICNDCELSCIYQTQDPVDVPFIETSILENILSLPYGAEIYFLLAKWNPLNFLLPLPLLKDDNAKNVLVVGMGPAGIGISHYLMNLGHNVFAIDAFTIKDLDSICYKPIKFWDQLLSHLPENGLHGFGGVADYGITHRWNKSNLYLARILLQRRKNNFKLLGNVRLGSSLSIRDAFHFGFNHIALCIGAGKPRVPHFFNYSSHNIYTSNEFLMTINQSKPYLKKNIDRLLIIRLPIVILGCGLSAIDSAVESIQYYIAQLDNFKIKYLKFLSQNPGIEKSFTNYQKNMIEEFLSHEEILAKLDNLGKIEFFKNEKAVTILSRSKIINSSAYRENFSEIEHAIATGVIFEENAKVKHFEYDNYGIVTKVHLTSKVLNANFVITAIGNLQNDFFDSQNYLTKISKFFLNEDLNISYLGDCNKFYSGSVVKALASAKDIFPYINDSIMRTHVQIDYKALVKKMEYKFNSYITSIKKIANNIIDIKIKSPMIAEKFQAGQFCRFTESFYTKDNLFKPKFFTIFDSNKKTGEINFIISMDHMKYKLMQNNFSNNFRIDIMGPNGSYVDVNNIMQYNKIVVFLVKNFRIVSIYQIAKFFQNQKFKIILFWSVSHEEDLFYIDKFRKITDYFFLNIEGDTQNQDQVFKGKLLDSIEFIATTNCTIKNYLYHADKIFVSVDDTLLDQIIASDYIDKSKIQNFYSKNFFCSAKGICGSCIMKSKEGKHFFACRSHFYSFNEFPANYSRFTIHSQKFLQQIISQP